MALSVEAAELVEIFQWLTDEESEKVVNDANTLNHVAQELADIMLYALRMADVLNINMLTVIEDKLQNNQQKYPVDKVRGSAKKYNKY